MHVHLPKGFHGWRELAKEVGIIVIGVLIALGFEQLVQAWHWRHQARMTREALTNEIVLSALWAEERVAVQPCLHDRISHLVAKLNSGREWAADPMVLGIPRHPIGGREIETSVPLVYRTPHRPWLSDEWETAKSTGIVDHMDRRDVRQFEFVFRAVNELRAYQDRGSLTRTSGQLSQLQPDTRSAVSRAGPHRARPTRLHQWHGGTNRAPDAQRRASDALADQSNANRAANDDTRGRNRPRRYGPEGSLWALRDRRCKGRTAEIIRPREAAAARPRGAAAPPAASRTRAPRSGECARG